MSTSAAVVRIVLVLGALAPAALAEPTLDTKPATRPQGGYIPVPVAPNTGGSGAVSSHLVYLHRCPVSVGCALKQGSDDSRVSPDSSSIAVGQVILGEFKQSDEVWAATVACVKTTFAPFNIDITDVDPGTAPHFENMVGGKSSDLGRSDLQNAGGVAPFDTGTCGEIPNAVSFTFDVYGPDAEQLCWTAAQEVAHTFGLDHEFLQKDPMTYIQGDTPKRFRDVDADCGELSTRPCSCAGRPKQNSYRLIVGKFGPGAPTPPEVTIQSPSDGKTIQPGFRMTVKAVDDVRIAKVELYADGTLVGMGDTSIGDRFNITGPTDLPMGAHTLEARAYDVQNVTASAMVNVTQGGPCTASKGCSGTDVCVDGVCLPGPDQPGGLGSKCQMDTECLSTHCTDASEEFKYCTEACTPSAKNSCPSGFECLESGASGVCWPAPDAGCCDAGTSPQGPLLLGFGVLALVLRRKRRALR